MGIYIEFITIPLIAGFIMDLILGDLSRFTHPVVYIGKIIDFMEKKFYRKGRHEFAAGVITFFTVSIVSVSVSCAIPLILNAVFGKIAAIAASSALCWFMIAAKSLKKESMKVYEALNTGDTEKARHAVSMIVGRDTSVLDRDGITRAAVETVAENTSDGVTAPLFFMAAAGIPGLYFYKAVNTMDSMIGYRNEKYMLFGRFAAIADDVLNFIPSRFTAIVMIAVSAVMKDFDGKGAFKIFRRDRMKHASPNSAQTESACAGALGLKLAGPAVYFGKVHEKEYIGDEIRKIEAEDIRRANILMIATAVATAAILSIVPVIIAFIM